MIELVEAHDIERPIATTPEKPRIADHLDDAEVLAFLISQPEPVSSWAIGVAVGFARGTRSPRVKTAFWSWHSQRHYSAVMAAIGRLEARGLVERVGRSAERTRRRKYVATAAGRAA